MKISDPQPPTSDPEVNTDDVDSSQKSDDDAPSPFSQLLAKKKGTDQDAGQLKRGKSSEGDTGPMGAVFPQGGKLFDPTIQAGQVESKHIVGVPVDLQQLVREISVVVNAAGNQQVNIEMNSSVLKGLHVRIERREGAVAIQFQSASEEVAGLLSKNLDALTQGLADRGVSVADIHVEGPKEYARTREYKNQSNPGGRGQSGRQGGGR
ncbi:MAG: flagellar hook-length control protein FliK [Terriglobales bacterium]